MLGPVLCAADSADSSASATAGASLVGSVRRSYSAVTNFSCGVRREMPQISKDGSPSGAIRLTSRVYFARGDKINVENIAPLRRRIVSDGTNLVSFMEGDEKGSKMAVSSLPADLLANLRAVPGTCEEILMRLDETTERIVPPLEGMSKRAVYRAAGSEDGSPVTVVNLDSSGRVALIEVYSDKSLKDRVMRTEYSGWTEVASGAWIPRLQKTSALIGGKSRESVTRIDDPAANTAVPVSMFSVEPFFKDVRF